MPKAPIPITAEVPLGQKAKNAGIRTAPRVTGAKKNAGDECFRSTQLMEAIRKALAHTARADTGHVFPELLEALLALTGSEFGFLTEAFQDEQGNWYTVSLAISDNVCSDHSCPLRQGLAAPDPAFGDPEHCPNPPVWFGKPVILNSLDDARSLGELPNGYPPMKTYMGLPLVFCGEFMGMAAVANHPGGYDESMAEFLEPLLSACAAIIHAKRARERQAEARNSLARAESRLKMMAQASHTGLWEWDLRNNDVHYSPEWKAQLGYSEKEIRNDLDEWRSRLHPDDLAMAVNAASDCFNNPRREYEKEFRLRHKDGSYRWILSRASAIEEEQGHPIRMLISHLDITDRKRREAREHLLRQVSERLMAQCPNESVLQDIAELIRQYTECAAVGIRLLDDKGKILYEAHIGFNDRFCETENSFSVKDCRSMCFDAMNGTINPQLTCYTPGGSFYTNGATHFLSTLSEQEKGQNLRRCIAAGYESVALIPMRCGKEILGVIHIADTRENAVPQHTVIALENVGLLLGNGILRLRAERALHKTQKQFQQPQPLFSCVLDNTFMLTAYLDAQFNFIWVNRAYAERCGHVPSFFPGRNYFELHPHEENEAIFRRIVETGEAYFAKAKPFLLADQSPRRTAYWDWSASPAKNDLGNVTAIALTLTDVTDRVQAMEAIAASEAKFSLIFRSAPILISLIDLDNGTYIEVNDMFVKISGFGREDAIGRTPIALGWMNEETQTRLTNAFQAKGSVREMELELHGRDGRVVYCLYNRDSLAINNRPALLSIALDITERKRLEAEVSRQQQKLTQSSKMATVGLLAAGVAHEINNPNFLILLNVALLKDAWEGILPILDRYYQENGAFTVVGKAYPVLKSELSEVFSDTLEGAECIKRIAKELSHYTHNAPKEPAEPVNLNSCLQSALMLLANKLKKSTERFSSAYASDLPDILGNASRLQQAIVNLVLNACEALPDKSKGISVNTKYDPEHEQAIVEVRDEGPGIPEEAKKHLTDPFFTTKREEGTKGLGLAVADAIAMEHGGWLEFESVPGRGATARLVIPRGESTTKRNSQ